MISPLAPYMLYIKIGAVVLVVAVIGLQRHTIRSQRDDIALYKQATASYVSAQASQLTTITDLQTRINQDVESRRLEQARADGAIAEADAAAAAIAAKLATTTKELAHVYDTIPAAREWGAVGVPAAVADRLPVASASR